MAINVTTDEILLAIQQMQAESPGEAGFTTRELAEALGVTTFTAREKIHKLHRKGQVETVKLRRKYIDGRVSDMAGYRLTGQ